MSKPFQATEAIATLRGMIKEGQEVYYKREGLTSMHGYYIGGIDNKGLPAIADITELVANALGYNIKVTKHCCGIDYTYATQLIMEISKLLFGDAYKLRDRSI